jgi:hypothetical protein
MERQRCPNYSDADIPMKWSHFVFTLLLNAAEIYRRFGFFFVALAFCLSSFVGGVFSSSARVLANQDCRARVVATSGDDRPECPFREAGEAPAGLWCCWPCATLADWSSGPMCEIRIPARLSLALSNRHRAMVQQMSAEADEHTSRLA